MVELEVEHAGAHQLVGEARPAGQDLLAGGRVLPVPGEIVQVALPFVQRLVRVLLVEVGGPRLGELRFGEAEARRRAGIALGIVAQQVIELRAGLDPVVVPEVRQAQQVDRLVDIGRTA
jgi:hypothetical protein